MVTDFLPTIIDIQIFLAFSSVAFEWSIMQTVDVYLQVSKSVKYLHLLQKYMQFQVSRWCAMDLKPFIYYFLYRGLRKINYPMILKFNKILV